MADNAQSLIDEIAGAARWPLDRERAAQSAVRVRRALRRANRVRHPEDLDLVKEVMGWEERCEHLGVGDVPREYVHDPLARKMAQAFADFMWSGSPAFEASDEADQPWLNLTVAENQLAAKLHRATRALIVPEGEAWAKIHTDRSVAIAPVITFTSRLNVTPLFRGEHVLAAAFLTEHVVDSGFQGRGGEIWRHFEVHSDGVVRHVLFKGACSEIGEQRDLTDRPETAMYPQVWPHGLPILAQRWTNELDDDDPYLGVSDYDGILDLYRGLNESRVIADENVRLTAKKRLFVSAELIDESGVFDAGADVVATEAGASVLGEGSSRPPVQAVEYSYDSVPLIQHTDHKADAILTAVGLVPQVVGRHVDGNAETGVALKTRLIPTVAAAQAKAREPDAKLPLLLQLAGMVDALPGELFGFNRAYRSLVKPPTVTRDSLLPRDETEVVTDNAAAVNAGIRSIRTAVREQWPEWTDNDVDEELVRIVGDESRMVAAPSFDTAPADPDVVIQDAPLP